MRCPICGKRLDDEVEAPRPFCSRRCRLVDLQRWLDERYGLPYESEDHPEEPGQADSET
jgi:endogenous inhibitor of DNA gyrase (YacG/DUF329 family)